MKQILSFLLLATLLFTQTAIAQEFAIDREIEAIRKVKDPKKRVEMMNALKRRLLQLNAKERERAIESLRQRRMQQKHQEHIQHKRMQNMQTQKGMEHPMHNHDKESMPMQKEEMMHQQKEWMKR